MKKLIILSSLLIFSQQLHAKCNKMAIGVMRESGFSLSFGGGSDSAGYYDKDTVNVPLTINNSQACYKQKQAIALKSDKKGESDTHSKVLVTPLDVEFENVPSPHQKQYILVERNPDRKQTKFHFLAFVCSGEIPLSVKALSSSVAELEGPKKVTKVDVGEKSHFATGIAASNLQEAYMNQIVSGPTYDVFANKYKEITAKEIDQEKPCCETYKIPSILTTTSVRSLSAVERSIASSYTTNANDVPNGCSKDFAETMKNYQLQNFSDNETLKGMKIKKKVFSKDLSFEWD